MIRKYLFYPLNMTIFDKMVSNPVARLNKLHDHWLESVLLEMATPSRRDEVCDRSKKKVRVNWKNIV